MIGRLSRDELAQVLLFLPLSHVCQYAQVNTTAYDYIISNQRLWKELLWRDFSDIIGPLQQGSSGEVYQSSLTTTSQNCCEEMKSYMCCYNRYYPFPFDRVSSKFKYVQGSNHAFSKILFGVANSTLNLPAMEIFRKRQLVIQDDAPYDESAINLYLVAQKHAQVPPYLTLQLRMMTQGPDRLRSDIMGFYYEAQCLVITVDTRHAWNDGYYPNHRCGNYSNSLSRAVDALWESKSYLKLEPPKACKGVLIVGVGVWLEAAPISKQRFLNDCALAFDALPLEYFEVTCDNAAVMKYILLRRFYTCHRQATLEDDKLVKNQPKRLPEEVPKTRCILS